jgi:hypothetical protein
MLKTLLFAAALTFLGFVSPAAAAPVAGVTGADVKPEAATHQVARRCWRHRGHWHCRHVKRRYYRHYGYGPRYYDYGYRPGFYFHFGPGYRHRHWRHRHWW